MWSKEGLMPFYPPSSPTTSFQASLAPFLTADGLPFADVLSAQDVQDAFAAEGISCGRGHRFHLQSGRDPVGLALPSVESR